MRIIDEITKSGISPISLPPVTSEYFNGGLFVPVVPREIAEIEAMSHSGDIQLPEQVLLVPAHNGNTPITLTKGEHAFGLFTALDLDALDQMGETRIKRSLVDGNHYPILDPRSSQTSQYFISLIEAYLDEMGMSSARITSDTIFQVLPQYALTIPNRRCIASILATLVEIK
jgi:hypothetical protein